MRILVVEDEPPIREGLLDRLGREGYSVEGAADGETALTLAGKAPFDLVLLDLMLPGIDGEEVLRRLRSGGDDTPVIVVSARAGEADRVLLLDRGADDYVVKPFSVRELVSRIRAVLRRRPPPAPGGTVVVGGATVDLDARRVTRGREVFPLTATEGGMLALLLRRRGHPVSREEFLREVWGYDRLPDTRTVDFHVVRLRRKLEVDPADPRWLRTVRGAGWVIEAEEGA
jgi:two-component system response regulator RegX3